ncbi:protein spire [Plakobranchus ocellatus]|uniref:Protein spire n=1 Tax=Plakobranchus ocellatus TaxID=259542 RepID=A0AAV3ZJ07_9GAST|nr:protein spire [Plakobranchus ocellatus]
MYWGVNPNAGQRLKSFRSSSDEISNLSDRLSFILSLISPGLTILECHGGTVVSRQKRDPISEHCSICVFALPAHQVDERKLKPKPPSPPDPHELLLNEIRSRPKLRPVRHGKLVVEKSAQLGSSCGAGGEEAGSETRAPAKRVIKPDFNLLLNNSFEESSDDEDRSNNNSPGTPEYRKHLRLYQQQIQQQQQQQQLYPRSDSMSMTPPPHHTWQRAVTQQALLRDPSQQQARPSRLQRRHTITICEAPLDHQVALKELPVLQEEEEEQPSPVRDSHSGGGSSSSSSSLSQLRPGVLPRASHSDNDLQSHASSMTSTMTINLRQAPSLVRRASFEHRRSLTSQTSTGLTAIPEQEDDGKNAGGSTDPGSRPLTRAKSQEQCPPPNPSPPCKGRAKAGLAMVGMRPSGGPYHPNSHHASHHSRSIAAASTAATAAGVPTSSKPHTTLASMQHVLSNPSFSSYSRLPQTQHAPSSSSSPFSRSFSSPTYPSTASPSSISSSLSSSSMSSPSFLPSTLEQSPQPGRATALDRSSSSQSPAYRCPPQGTNIHDRAMLTQEDSRFEGRISRWRMPAAQYSDQVEAAPSNCNNMGYLPDTSASPRRWATGITGDSSDSGSSYNPVREGNPPDSSNQHSVVVGAGYYPETLSPEEARHKRLSLDAGMSMYYEEALKEDNTESLPSSPYLGRDQGIVRKTSVGLDRGVRGRTGFRRIKSPEEEERVTRWRALQEDERQARWRPQQQEKTGGSPVANQRQVPFRRSGVAALTPPSPSSPESLRPENTDVLQQRMADEEARFDRWRRLEEGTGSHPLLDHLNRRSPQEASPNMNLKRQDQSQTIVVAAPPGIAQPSSLGPGLEPARHQSHVASPPDTTSDLAPMHDMLPMPKRWQNPVECLSLTLEEVTHIRSVLTKAELESLMSHPDLYQQVAKSKLCFTCKTTRFALFGEWGTKCKFCKRTVCAKCLRKMNVPADHFRNIPVYTLSPTPLTSEMQDFIQDFIKGAPAPSVPATRDHSPVRHDAPQLPSSAAAVAASATGSTSSSSTVAAGQTTLSPGMNSSKPGFLSGPAKALHRSQSALVTGQRPKLFAAASSTSSSSSSSSSSSTSSSSLSSAIKGPMMAICCDCKGMVMEIIRATRASLTLLSSQEGKASLSATSAAAYQGSPPSALPTSTTALSPSASLNHSARQYLASKAKLVSN